MKLRDRRERSQQGRSRRQVFEVSYRQGMADTVLAARRLPELRYVGSGIPAPVREAITRERIDELGGSYGDPSWGEPIQYDRLVVKSRSGVTEIEVFNRAIHLVHFETEPILRIHRVCEVVRRAGNRPG